MTWGYCAAGHAFQFRLIFYVALVIQMPRNKLEKSLIKQSSHFNSMLDLSVRNISINTFLITVRICYIVIISTANT